MPFQIFIPPTIDTVSWGTLTGLNGYVLKVNSDETTVDFKSLVNTTYIYDLLGTALKIWIHPNDGNYRTLSGSTFTSITNKISGSGFTYTSLSGITRGTRVNPRYAEPYTLSSEDTANFANTGYMRFAGAMCPTASDWCIICVSTYNTNNVTHFVSNLYTSGSMYIGWNIGLGYMYYGNGGGMVCTWAFSPSAPSAGTQYMWTIQNISGLVYVRQNGKALTATGTPTASNTTQTNDYRLFHMDSGVSNEKLAQYYYITGVLTTANRDKCEGYLAWLYNITLDSGHTYFSVAPT